MKHTSPLQNIQRERLRDTGTTLAFGQRTADIIENDQMAKEENDVKKLRTSSTSSSEHLSSSPEKKGTQAIIDHRPRQNATCLLKN